MKTEQCPKCPGTRKFTEQGLIDHMRDKHGLRVKPTTKKARDKQVEPDWNRTCAMCGMSPVVPLTGMCGPCTFGESDTIHGNW